MSPSIWQAVFGSGVIADLSSQVRLRLRGPDAVRYLNGQVTQDVRKLVPGLALPACITNHKGKLEAWVHLSLDPTGALLISGPEDLSGFLQLRLEKYLIADDCVLEDVTDSTALVHFTGPAASLTPLLAEGEQPAALPRFGCPGFDLWITLERLPFWRAAFPVLSLEDQSSLEVLQGVPAWGAELTPDLLPPEAGLDLTAIDYHKGCYIGQEVISRIRSVGRVNRHLARLIQTEGLVVEPGFVLRPAATPSDPSHPPETAPRAEAAPTAGRITRTALHPLTGQCHALAFLRRGTTGPFQAGPEDGPAGAILEVQKTLDD
jgi:folate-binding protein YgfZ